MPYDVTTLERAAARAFRAAAVAGEVLATELGTILPEDWHPLLDELAEAARRNPERLFADDLFEALSGVLEACEHLRAEWERHMPFPERILEDGFGDHEVEVLGPDLGPLERSLDALRSLRGAVVEVRAELASRRFVARVLGQDADGAGC